MKASLLLALVCTALLAAGARADASEDLEELMGKVQDFAQKAMSKARSAFSSVQESEVAQQARQWLAANANRAKERLAWVKERLAELWKRTPDA
ncbi:APOC3 protein, partial [Chordeiles acutipennis]|nr:APOC3 protein [Chordeiles acutipennis]